MWSRKECFTVWNYGCRSSQQRLQSTAATVRVTHTRPRNNLLVYRDDDNATALVDGLIQYTRELMKESSSRHHVVAYSGGVDSSLVAGLLLQASDGDDHSVQAVLGISPAVSQEQVIQARNVACHLNVSMREVKTTEGSDGLYIENNGQACFACKTHLYSSLQAVHQSASTCIDGTVQLYNGTNQDDLQDSTRVGLVAAANFQVYSPLQYTSKHNVRRAARHLGLPNWNAAAAPCLRSRLALGVEATKDHLNTIEQAERFVKKTLLSHVLHSASNVRVRMLTKQRAMIEVDADLLSELRLGETEERYFQSLGFSSVSARSFKTGSVSRRTTKEASLLERENHGVDADRELMTAVG